MIDTKYRKPYQTFIIEPLLRSPIARLSPLFLTFCACLLGLATLALIVTHHPYLALTALILSGFCDTLDGSLSRHQDTVSPIGAALDITSDRLVEFAIILGLYLYAPHTRALGALFMLGAAFLCVTTFLVVGILSENDSEKSFHYSPGLMERAEAFTFFALMILIPSAFTLLSTLFATLTFATALMRLISYCGKQRRHHRDPPTSR